MYEEGVTSEVIDQLFQELRDGLVPLIQEIVKKEAQEESFIKGYFPKHQQEELSVFLLNYMGFDMNAGVLSESAHPFTMDFGPKDVRLTNHYHENDIISSIFSIIHEGGHGIFDQGIKEQYYGTDIENIPFLGLHESQSRFYENILGRNINFWKPI